MFNLLIFAFVAFAVWMIIGRTKSYAVLFYRDSCPFSREFIPIWHSLMGKTRRKLYMFDITKNEKRNNKMMRKMRDSYDIKTVPHMIKFDYIDSVPVWESYPFEKRDPGLVKQWLNN